MVKNIELCCIEAINSHQKTEFICHECGTEWKVTG